MPMQLPPPSAAYSLLWVLLLKILLRSAQSYPQVPCLFIFGDSLSDDGNNNDLPTMAKANYAPYGVDFPGGQTGSRFTNGQDSVDVIAKHLGFEESVPSYASTATLSPERIIKGVNYASGSAGIRPETGQHLGVRIPLAKQLENHKRVISRIGAITGDNTTSYLKKCIYMINVGSNDYLNNYFIPENYTTSNQYTVEQFTGVLTQQYRLHIQTLYGMGARKLALFGLGQLGCTPQAISRLGFLKILCSGEANVAATLFNNQLHDLVDKLNCELTNAHLTCINMDEIFILSSLGFLELTVPCCSVRWDGQCEEGSVPCSNRESYIFFDNFHPTEAMNIRTGGRAYSALSPLDVHPIDIKTLAQIPDLD